MAPHRIRVGPDELFKQLIPGSLFALRTAPGFRPDTQIPYNRPVLRGGAHSHGDPQRQQGTGRHGGRRRSNRGKRRFLIGATCVVGGVGGVAATAPFVMSLFPERARARPPARRSKSDIAQDRAGPADHVEWRGKVVWVINRTPAMLDSLPKLDARLADPQFGRAAAAALLQERAPLDQAAMLDRGRHLHASRLLADLSPGSRARRPRPRLARRLLLSVPPVEIRPGRPRLQGRAGADQPRRPAAHATCRRHEDRDRRRRRRQVGVTEPAHGKASQLDRRALSADRALGVAVGQVRRAEEFQLLVLLRLARGARAGDADRHRASSSR